MKKLTAGSIMLAVSILLITACKKENDFQIVSSPGEEPNTVQVAGPMVSVKLIGVQGFANPFFNLSVDGVFNRSFRFNGTYNDWVFSGLIPGLHSLRFTCSPICINENGNERLRFIVAGDPLHGEVSTRRTGHCTYEFWMRVK